MSVPQKYGIIVVGASKEAKTTLVCFLAGMPLVVFKDKFGKISVDKTDDQKYNEPVIGCTIKSQTSIPYQLIISDEKSLWDSPGK